MSGLNGLLCVEVEEAMDLKEAIAHAEERAGDCRTECRREHKQLAEWLRELEKLRRPPAEMSVQELRVTIARMQMALRDKVCGDPMVSVTVTHNA